MNFSAPSESLVSSPSWKPETRQQNHTRRLSHRQFSWHNDLRPRENYVHNYVHTGSDPEVVDISLGVSSIMLSTLRDASKLSPVPFLSAAAGIALAIVGAVQKARRNKDGFKALADDSCELVCVIIRTYKDRPGTDDLPIDLVNDLQQLVTVLASIQKFAQKGASRNFFKAIVRSSVDAEKIQHYRGRMQQSMRVFNLQSDIILRETVAKLASRQAELDNGAPPVPSSSAGPS